MSYSKIKFLGCACGAISATAAAVEQMSAKEVGTFHHRIRMCPTCIQDRKTLSEFQQTTHAEG